MQFNGNANNLDLYSDARNWCGLDNDDVISYTLKQFTRDANFALDRLTSLAFKSDNKWPFDDTNNSGALIATANLVSGTASYVIAVTYLKLRKIRIKDSNGNLTSIRPTDRRDLSDRQLTEESGDPKRYYKSGNLINLVPAPNYASTDGLEYEFQRAPSYFAITDTTKIPGFPTHFHRLFSLYPARDYCLRESMNTRAANIQIEIDKLEAEFIEHFTQRNFDQKQSFSLRKEDYGEVSMQETRGRLSTRNPDGIGGYRGL